MQDTLKIMKYLTDGSKTYHEICERFGIGTQSIRRMVKAHPSHFVISQHPVDNRIQVLTLTPRGIAYLEKKQTERRKQTLVQILIRLWPLFFFLAACLLCLILIAING